MCKNDKPLKIILNEFFDDFWSKNSHKYSTDVRENIKKNVNDFLDCGDFSKGYSAFICPRCKEIHQTPFSCKSRFCSSCGVRYAEEWANNLKHDLIECAHRHITFSMPTGKLRDFFFYHRFHLADLAKAAYQALKYSFKKIGIYHIGVIINIHTFSRKVEWNPHIHAIVTFGGLNKDGDWKNAKTLPWQVLRKSWQKCLLDIISKFAKEKDNQRLKNLVSLSYKNYPQGFYVNADSQINNIFNIAKYLGRYLARPAIAEYRIIDFNKEFVKFWYKLPDSDNKLHLTLSMEEFLGKLLSHIPPKNFKMVRRFGLYSRRNKIKMPKKNRLFKTKTSWAERMIKSYGINPMICRKCATSLELLEVVHISYGVIYQNPDYP